MEDKKEIIIANRYNKQYNKKTGAELPMEAVVYCDGKIILNLDKVYEFDTTDIVDVDCKLDRKLADECGIIKLKTKQKKFKIKNIAKILKVYEVLSVIGRHPIREFMGLNFLPETSYTCENVVLDGINFTFWVAFSEDFEKCMKTVKYILQDAKAFYEKIINQTSKEFLETANMWRQEEGKYTAATFKKLIDLKDLIVEINEQDFCVYFYADEDLFTDHQLQYIGSIDSTEHSIDLC